MIRKFLLWALAVVALPLTFTATAFAASTVPTEDSTVLELLKAVVDAFRGGQPAVAASLAVFAVLALAKRYWTTGKVGRFLHGDVGGPLTLFGMALSGSVAAQAQTGWQWSMLTVGLHVGALAIGGYVALARLVVDPVQNSTWYKDRAPGWFRAVFSLVVAAFGKSPAIVEAERAGADAVAANPAPGADSIAGPATRF